MSSALYLAALAGCAGAPPGGEHETDEPALERTGSGEAALSGPVSRSVAIANAETWVAAKLTYCQSPNGQPDPDTACAATCSRTSDPAWDPYRSDCSGFVSWAWELPPPGLTTAGFAPFDTSVSATIPCVDLRPGDAANRYPTRGHIVLFKAWITPGTEAVFVEEPGCSAAQPYAHEFTSAVTCSGTSVDIAYEGATFEAIRYGKIEDDPDGGAGDAGEPDAAATSRADAGAPLDAGASRPPDAGGVGEGAGGGDAGTQGTGPGPTGGGGVSDAGGGTAATMDAAGGSTGCALASGPSSAGGGVGVLPVLGILAARRRRSRRSRGAPA